MRENILRIVLFSVLLVSMSMSYAQQRNPAYEEYIAEWRDLAEEHQMEYGIPASIILAQGLLESSAGQSELARNANNHFGIKCVGDWFGPTYSYDDDRKGECFRVYSDAGMSYKDHAIFLQKPRYKTCFDIPVTDYAGWARRLKECGYATDPAYPQKLIRIIETYGLASTAPAAATAAAIAPVAVEMAVEDSPAIWEEESAEILSAREEKNRFLRSHATKKSNGLKYVVAQAGDSYANVAFRLNVRERDLRMWNDALGRTLKPGDFIYYTGYKASQTKDKAKTYYWVHPGESVWLIGQREGIKVASIRALNGWDDSVTTFRSRQKILLRKEKKK